MSEAREPREAAPAPTPETSAPLNAPMPVATPTAQAAGALFGSAMGAGPGPPSSTGLIGHLARCSAEDCKAGALEPQNAHPALQAMVPEVVLALQRTAGNTAVTGMLARWVGTTGQFRAVPGQTPAGQAGQDDQEKSWANPMKRASTEPALVGTIYFRTKDSNTDPQDEAVLLQLAKAYAPSAVRGEVKPGGERGLRGEIVGYADPRPSVAPDNARLSSERADIVGHRLIRSLALETKLIEGAFDFTKRAGGVAPPVSAGGASAEHVSLGWQRRAEIFIAGVGSEPEPAKLAPAPVPEPKPPPDDGWERWVPYIQKCDGRIIDGVAGQMIAYFAGWGRTTRQVFDYTGTLPILLPIKSLPSGPGGKMLSSPKLPLGAVELVKHGGTLPFRPRKPPWWDARTSGYQIPPLGHHALSPKARKCHELTRRALMLIRDMREFNRIHDLTLGAPDRAYLRFMAELRKDTPDVEKLREYAVTIEYLMFIWDATKDLALEVRRSAGEL